MCQALCLVLLINVVIKKASTESAFIESLGQAGKEGW